MHNQSNRNLWHDCKEIVNDRHENNNSTELRAEEGPCTVSHPIKVDQYLEDRVCQAPIHVQHTSTHDPAITSHDEPLHCPRLVLLTKGQPQEEILSNQSQLVQSNRITRNQLGCPPLGTHSIPKVILSKGRRRKYKWNFVRPPKQNVQIQNELILSHVHQTSVSAFEWNLLQPPNLVSHSTQVPPNFVSCSIQVPSNFASHSTQVLNQKDSVMCHGKVGGKSYSWDFYLAPSASTPSCHSPL